MSQEKLVEYLNEYYESRERVVVFTDYDKDNVFVGCEPFESIVFLPRFEEAGDIEVSMSRDYESMREVGWFAKPDYEKLNELLRAHPPVQHDGARDVPWPTAAGGRGAGTLRFYGLHALLGGTTQSSGGAGDRVAPPGGAYGALLRYEDRFLESTRPAQENAMKAYVDGVREFAAHVARARQVDPALAAEERSVRAQYDAHFARAFAYATRGGVLANRLAAGGAVAARRREHVVHVHAPPAGPLRRAFAVMLALASGAPVDAVNPLKSVVRALSGGQEFTNMTADDYAGMIESLLFAPAAAGAPAPERQQLVFAELRGAPRSARTDRASVPPRQALAQLSRAGGELARRLLVLMRLELGDVYVDVRGERLLLDRALDSAVSLVCTGTPFVAGEVVYSYSARPQEVQQRDARVNHEQTMVSTDMNHWVVGQFALLYVDEAAARLRPPVPASRQHVVEWHRRVALNAVTRDASAALFAPRLLGGNGTPYAATVRNAAGAGFVATPDLERERDMEFSRAVDDAYGKQFREHLTKHYLTYAYALPVQPPRKAHLTPHLPTDLGEYLLKRARAPSE